MIIFESKAQMSGNVAGTIFQNAIADSAKDELRKAESLNAIKQRLFLAVWSLLIPTCAFAWGGAGHQLIAAEAYRELSPELKAETFAVLQAHPDFAKWTNSYRPNANFDLAAYVFMRSSIKYQNLMPSLTTKPEAEVGEVRAVLRLAHLVELATTAQLPPCNTRKREPGRIASLSPSRLSPIVNVPAGTSAMPGGIATAVRRDRLRFSGPVHELVLGHG
jgi:hypothetical protein